MGRHVIGYEVQKVLAAVDQFTLLNQVQKVDLPDRRGRASAKGSSGVLRGALDTRIDGALVGVPFQPRENLPWQEPIYRNVWALLYEFGDAEVASLIAPRPLVIEAAAAPEVAGPPAVKAGRSGGAAPGKITTPKLEEVRREFQRAAGSFQKLNQGAKLTLIASKEGTGALARAVRRRWPRSSRGWASPNLVRVADEVAPEDVRVELRSAGAAEAAIQRTG